MRGREFLAVARRSAQGTTEADWRDAAGRAYYALMLEARDLLQRWGFVLPRRDQIHAHIRLRFIYSSDVDMKSVGLVLEKLLEMRNYADYQIAQPGRFFATSANVNQAIVDAEVNISLLDLIDADPVRRAQAIAAIQP